MLYLCTTGTSAAKLWKGSLESRFDESKVKGLGGIKLAANLLLDTFKQYKMNDEQALHTKLSAEIHSLARLNINKDDQIVLFASETLDGQACALAVANYLEQQGYQAKVEVIIGLQTNDARKFNRIGVVEFIKKTLHYIDTTGADYCVLNPTGGFKALVPYAVLLGMIRKIECRYIFEFSKSLIELPPLPLDFDRSRLEAIKIVLELIERKSSISTSEFEQLVVWEQRNLFRILFEKEGDDITLSAVGVLILEELQKPSTLTVFVSQEAMKGLIKLRKIRGVDPDKYLKMVAQEPSKFDQAKHGNAGEGLTWLKPGNTTDRYLVSIEDNWRLLVWEMYDHHDYEERYKLQNLGKAVIDQRTSKYAPFFRMDFMD